MILKFGRSPWRRVGGINHYLIARLEGRAVRFSVVEVGLMALGSAKMVENSISWEKRVISMQSATKRLRMVVVST